MVGIVVACLVAAPVRAHADDKALKPYAGKIVFSPDTPPTTSDEIVKFLKINVTKDDSYDVIKGPPWPLRLVAVLSKDPGTKPIQLVFADKTDKKLAPMHTVDIQQKKKLVIAASEANVAAGFEAGKTYVVRIMQGKTVLAKAELKLRE